MGRCHSRLAGLYDYPDRIAAPRHSPDSAADRGQRLSAGVDLPDPPSPPDPDALRIGGRLRRSRLARGLSLDDVARTSGLTKGFISQVERDMTSASVASLVRLCGAIGITMGSLFEPSSTSLIRRAEPVRINFGGIGLRETLLTPRGSAEVQVIRTEIAPGGGSGAEPYGLDAKSEVVHLLEGELVVQVDGEEVHLTQGDTLTFAPDLPHAWHNRSDSRPAVVLWVLVPSPW